MVNIEAVLDGVATPEVKEKPQDSEAYYSDQGAND